MGTEIRTFTSLKDSSEFALSQTSQYKALFEDYSQWLGSVLRDAESKEIREYKFAEEENPSGGGISKAKLVFLKAASASASQSSSC